MPQQFASDNNAGICPEALEALVRVNAQGHVPGYGDDEWTDKACARLRELFEVRIDERDPDAPAEAAA